MKHFYNVLVNSLIAGVTNSFLWFAVTFWAYLETRSVLATSIIGGSFMVLTTLLGMYFGTFVDHQKKKTAMLYSSIISLVSFSLAALLYFATPQAELLRLSSVQFWSFVVLILIGAIGGNLRTIALSTTVTLLVPEKMRDRANGMVGTVTGIYFAVTSVFSGLVVGLLGMDWALWISLVLTVVTLLHLLTISIPEKHIAPVDGTSKVDFKGAMGAIQQVPGLLGLIFFATLNNFLGGAFMSLMDPYGLTLVSVETWGTLFGFISIGFIFGGLVVAKKGLGKNPLKTLFVLNLVMWTICIFFTARPWIALMAIGMFIYMSLIPAVEASEQTIIQKVVPLNKQGRVFGFAQTVESAASPLTAFLIGPLAQFIVIPFMTDGRGAETIGNWYGTGTDRAISLIFMVTGVIGLIVTVLAMKSRAYHTLSEQYTGKKNVPAEVPALVSPKG